MYDWEIKLFWTDSLLSNGPVHMRIYYIKLKALNDGKIYQIKKKI